MTDSMCARFAAMAFRVQVRACGSATVAFAEICRIVALYTDVVGGRSGTTSPSLSVADRVAGSGLFVHAFQIDEHEVAASAGGAPQIWGEAPATEQGKPRL
jgi:hypothetical protein